MNNPPHRCGPARRGLIAMMLAALALAALALAGCVAQEPGPAIPADLQTGPATTPPSLPTPAPPTQTLAQEAQALAPHDPKPGECWGQETIPAVIETVTEQAEVSPVLRGPDGAVIRPAAYQTQTRQRIVTERRAVWFRVPCGDAGGPGGLAETLQRALKVRGFYRGPLTGLIDDGTRDAVRRYQAAQGLDSGTLSLGAARQLGLVAYDRKELK